MAMAVLPFMSKVSCSASKEEDTTVEMLQLSCRCTDVAPGLINLANRKWDTAQDDISVCWRRLYSCLSRECGLCNLDL